MFSVTYLHSSNFLPRIDWPWVSCRYTAGDMTEEEKVRLAPSNHANARLLFSLHDRVRKKRVCN